MKVSSFARGLRRSVLLLGILAGSTTALAQSVYLPVQYQFGRYGEIFYGGANGNFLSNPYLFAPEVNRNSALQNAYGTGDAAGLPSPYTPAIAQLSDSMNWPNATYHPTVYRAPFSNFKPLIYSDLEPGVDVSRHGFTIDDARNEAYLNVPRYQVGSEFGHPAPLDIVEPMGPVPPVTRAAAAKAKQVNALQLIRWAQAEHAAGKNPKLVDELLKQAAKFDAPAAAKARADMKLTNAPVPIHPVNA